MRKIKAIIKATVEEIESGVEVGEVVELSEEETVEAEAVIEAAPEVEQAEELAEAAEEVDEAFEAADVVEEAVVTIESIAAALEEILESGEEAALEPQAAAFVSDQVAGVEETLGLIDEGADSEIVPALESFVQDKRAATVATLESLTEKAKAGWETLVRLFKKAVAAVGAFLKEIFTAQGRVNKALAAIQARARNSAKETPAADTKIALRSLTRILSADDATVKDSLNNTVKVLDQTLNRYLSTSLELTKAVKAGEMEKAVEITDKFEELAKTGTLVISGGYQYQVIGTDQVGTFVKANEVTTTEVALESYSDLRTGLNTAVAILRAQANKKSDLERLNKEASELADFILKATKDESAGKETFLQKFKDNRKQVSAVNKLMRPITQIQSISFGALRASLPYFDRSLKAYGL